MPQSNELCCLTGHSDKVLSVTCTSDGTVCSSSLDGTLRLWKPNTDSASVDARCHNAEVTSVASTGDGQMLATASRYIETIAMMHFKFEVVLCFSGCGFFYCQRKRGQYG